MRYSEWARRYYGKVERTSTEPKVHDYRNQGWAWSCVFREKRDDKGHLWSGYGFGPDIRKDDYVILGHENGDHATYRVTKIRYERDPRDMYHADFEYAPGLYDISEDGKIVALNTEGKSVES